jgi:hypothetical protein
MTPKPASGCIPIAAVIFVTAMILGGTALAQEAGTLNGTLVDPQGAALPNSTIQVRWNYVDGRMSLDGVRPKNEKQPRKRVLQVSTDSAGRFSITLPSGNWDVFAYRDGFAPTCTIALIEPGRTTSIDLHFSRLAAMSIE